MVRYARSNQFAKMVHWISKILLLIQWMDLHENTVGSGNNLSDDRFHKVQYTDPIIGHF